MPKQFCTFHVGDLFLGIEVERVQEVLRDCDITPVPTAPLSIRGLINLIRQPAAPPAAASSAPSPVSCLARRLVPAPSAARTASSRSRIDPS